jgi:hypothetical protein
MTTSHKITTFLAVALAGFLICAICGWHKERAVNDTLISAQATDKKAEAPYVADIAKVKADTAVKVAKLTALKKTIKPAQIATALRQVVALPVPVEEVTDPQDAPKLSVGDIVLPAADAKPLFDAQVDCQITTVKMQSDEKTIADLNAVLAVKSLQITQLNVALKGGTKWHRTITVIKHVGIGVAIGGITATILILK